MEKIEILYIHQSSDLYGSDKVLLNLVSALKERNGRHQPIVILPSKGPLYSALIEKGVEVHVGPVAKLERKSLSFSGLLRLARDVVASQLFLRKLLKSRRPSLIHSNTLAVLSGCVYSFLFRVPHVWHVHELIVAPAMLRKVYPRILNSFSDRIICISQPVRDWLVNEQPKTAAKCVILWNGIPDLLERKADVQQERRALQIAEQDLVVALVGRINRWKGQGVLVDAMAELHRRGVENVRALIVGSAPEGQEHFLDSLKSKAADSPAADRITILPYVDDISRIWQLCDIAAVPSIEPEPFGLVAIEAMAAGRPVVGAAHGGLAYIVAHEKTGLLVEPGNALALADAIERLHRDQLWTRKMGQAGRERQAAMFSLRAQVGALQAVYDRLLGA